MVLTVTKCLKFGFAMDGRVCTPKRVKDILSSFLHGVIPEDVPQQSSSDEALPHTGDGEIVDKVDRPTRCVSATDRTAFFLRVHTYSPLTWFAKPAWFSALVCARYGWVNVDVDVLQCVGCGSHLSGRMLRSFEPQVYAECCKKLVESLKTAHSAFCCWVSHPSPESFLRLPLSSRAMAEMEFVSLLKSVLRLQAELPRIEAVQLESMGLTRATLLSLHHYAGTADQSCDDGSHDLDDMFCSACMLAVCGWAASSSVGGSQLRCRYCNRTAGLWNYTHSSPSLPGVCDESHDNGNSLSPGGDTCGTQSKSHDSSSGSPAGGTACCPTPESSDVLDRSVEDADKHSTGSGSQEEDISGKGMSSPADDARDEGGEGGVMAGSRKQESDISSGNISNGDTESESTANDESGAENGISDSKLAEEDGVQQIENEILPGSSEEDIEQTESDEMERSEEMRNDSKECCIQIKSDNDKSIEQTETDKGENIKEEHIDRTESDNEEHVEQTKNESDDSQHSHTGSEVDTVDGCCLQEVKCIERSVEVDIKPQHDISQPVDLKSNNLKTENQEEHSADESECKDVGKGGKSTVGEGDEPMEVDNLGADKDETGQRTTVDSSEKGSPTGQQSSDSGQNGMISHTEEEVEPAAKRRRIMKPTRATFDPVAEHHTWCPWVLPDVPTDRLHDTLTVGDENRQPGWRRFLEMLTPADSQQSHSLISIVKTSPPCVGLRSIRKLFLGWTKLATPDS